MSPKSEMIFAITQIVIVSIMVAALTCATAIREVVESIVWLALIGGSFGTLWLVLTLRAIGKMRRIQAERDYPQIMVSGQYDYLEMPRRKLLPWRRK